MPNCRRGISTDDSTPAAIFQQVFIPRKMDEVENYERDHESISKGNHEGIYYQTIMGLKDDLSGICTSSNLATLITECFVKTY